MKKRSFLSRWAIASAAITISASTWAAVPESFSRTNNLPPPDGVYVTPALWHAAYANGIIIRDVRHRRFTENFPIPPLGATDVHSFSSTVNFQLSMDNGATFSPASGTALVKVRVRHVRDLAGTSFFATEMLALDLTSGTMMLRESPTLPSRGRTTIRPVGGGYMIGSFFDIFTEVSLDGGQTWTPGQQPAHVEFRNDPALVPSVVTPTPLLPPPNDVYVSPQQWHALYAQGIVIKDVRHKFFTPSQPPPPRGASQIHQFDSQLDMHLSLNSGNTFQFVTVPARVSVRVSNIGSSGQDGLYDTEMLQLDIHGGNLPPGLMVRESPTLPSRGGTQISPRPDGGFLVDSFFDIFTDLSVDGGQTWSSASNGPVRVELQDPAPPQPAPTPNLPPPNGEYVSPQQWHALYANGIIVSNVTHNRFTQSQPPPPPGGQQVHMFDSFVSLDLIQSGLPAVQITAPAMVTVLLRSTMDSGNTRYFDTEMLQLDLQGGNLPKGVMVRESPTRASLGRTSLRPSPDGTYQVDSFFDIFTELSLDGGQTWSPSVRGPGTVALRTPSTKPINIGCPTDLKVPATGPAGAVVNFPVNASGGCDAAPTVTCTPPSGSTFPVGTTTVVCVATDSCGNQITCSFNVTVEPPIQPPREYFFPRPLLPPPGVYISPRLWHVLYANGIVIRDVRHRGFTDRQPPPPLGGRRVHTFNSTVDFEFSTTGPTGAFQAASGLARVTVGLTHLRDQDGKGYFETEMLALDLVGGPLRLRESPTRRSQGQTTLRSVPGGFMVDSFFDIFTEISLDGGQTWVPAQDAAHVELRPDPALVPPVPAPSPLLPPPNGTYVSPQQWHALYAQGIVIKDVRHKLFSHSMPPPSAGQTQFHEFQSVLDLQLSRDGGNTFQHVRAQVPVVVNVTGVGSGHTAVYDTEMLALDFQLPGGVIVRESPTEASRGMTTISNPFGDDFPIASFFDIFTEVSLDNGQTWSPANNGPVRMELQQQAAEQNNSSPVLPPLESQYVSPERWHALYANGIIISNVSHNRFTQSLPPPPPGQSQTHSFGSQVTLMISLNNGQTFLPATGSASVGARVSSTVDFGNTRYFDTEMLQLFLNLPPQQGGLPIMVRESPTRASLGRTSVRQSPNGYHISSFFDIFTELSLDGGQSWSPSVSGPATVGVRPVPPVAPMVINCPPNITVPATSSSGAVVTYLVTTLWGDCPFGPVTVTCTPPSGSTFPVGTTTVTCVGGNGCGEHPTCSFTVTVLPVKRLFPTNLLPPPGGQYVSPQQWHALYANGIILTNAVHRRFTQSVPPPPPGQSLTHQFGSQVNFEISNDGGKTFQPMTGMADVVVRVTNTGAPGEDQVFDTEMLALNLTGPAMVMIRESPTRASTGGTRMRQGSSGVMISSFFDVFTELSLDGGQTWSRSEMPAHVELQPDPGAMGTILQNARLVGGKPTFSVNTEPGLLYLLECTDDLLGADWFTIGGLFGTGTEASATDYFGDDGRPRYYRAKVEEPGDPEQPGQTVGAGAGGDQ